MSNPSGSDPQPAMEAPAADLRKTENKKKAEELRAKVIVQLDKAGKKPALQQAKPSEADTVTATNPETAIESESEPQLPPEDLLSPEALIAAGKAAAQAKIEGPGRDPQGRTAPVTRPSTAISPRPPNAMAPQSTAVTSKQPISERLDDEAQQVRPARPNPLIKLNDAYYADLKLWLEITGYHDIQYRKNKIECYELEQQAAHIANRLQKLQQDAAVKSNPSVHPTPAMAAANASGLPSVGFRSLNSFPPPLANSAKRQRSPETEQQFKARRTDRQPHNLRAADSSEEPNRGRRPNPRPVGRPLESRVTYPSPRRGSPIARDDNAHHRRDRDSSLERHQQFYGPGLNGRREYDLFDPSGRGPPVGYEDSGRLRYSSVNDRGRHDDGRPRDDRLGGRPDMMRGGKRRPR